MCKIYVRIHFGILNTFTHLTHYQTTNFSIFQTERVCRRQFQLWQKRQKVIQIGRKHCGKTLWVKEKLLVTSNFSFTHSVSQRLVSLGRQKVSLCGNGLTITLTFVSIDLFCGECAARSARTYVQSDLDLHSPDRCHLNPPFLHHPILSFIDPEEIPFWKRCGKRGNTGNSCFLLFPQCFNSYQNKFQIFSHIYFGICKSFTLDFFKTFL